MTCELAMFMNSLRIYIPRKMFGGSKRNIPLFKFLIALRVPKFIRFFIVLNHDSRGGKLYFFLLNM